MIRFKDTEVPDEHDWSKAAVKVRLKVYNSLRELSKQWQADENIIKATINRIEKAMETEFPAFQKEMREIERDMTGKSEVSGCYYDSTQEEENSFIPDFITNTFSRLGTGAKVLLGIGLSPFLLVGLIARLPYLGFKTLQKKWTQHRMEVNFKAATGNSTERKIICEKYAETTVKFITDNLRLKAMVEEDMSVLFKFLEAQKQTMLAQINQDRTLLENLELEEFYEKGNEKTYQPLVPKCEMVKHLLKHFMLIYIPYFCQCLHVQNVYVPHSVICSGTIADISVAKTCGLGEKAEQKKVCVRQEKSSTRYTERMRYTSALQNCR